MCVCVGGGLMLSKSDGMDNCIIGGSLSLSISIASTFTPVFSFLLLNTQRGQHNKQGSMEE